jgi:hypothetical protein
MAVKYNFKFGIIYQKNPLRAMPVDFGSRIESNFSANSNIY